MVTNMWKVLFCYYCWCFAGTALSELAVSQVRGDHDQVPGRSPPSDTLNTSFQVKKGFLSSSTGLLPPGGTYSRVGLQFFRRILSPPESLLHKTHVQAFLRRDDLDHSHHRTFSGTSSNILDSSSESDSESTAFLSAEESNAFQVFAATAKTAAAGGAAADVAGDNNMYTPEVDTDDGDSGDRFRLEMIIGFAIAVPIFLGLVLVIWLWYTFCYLPRSKGPTLPRRARNSRSAPAGDSFSTSNMSKIQLLGTWLSSCSSISSPFSGNHSRKRQVVWSSSACEMPFSKLQSATNNFSVNNLLGEGGTSRVYRAKLDDDTLTAVKRLDPQFDRRRTAMQFQSEVDLMRLVRHPNLVSLLGFCKHGDQRLLVYELMQNGSLEDQLYGPTKGAALTWNLRIKIALESARGLEYLHEHCVPPVVHRDLKASNILLDASFNAKISDFGLATPLEGLTQEESLQLIGTVGYVAPEFFETGALTEKSDVYAFGVVLLELLTGRKPIDHSLPPDEHSLVNWTKPQLKDRRRLPQIVAPTLRSHLNLKHLHQVAAVAALCVCEEPSYRPLIADVVQSLVPLVPIELGGALRPSHAHNPRSPVPVDITPKSFKSRSRSFNHSKSTNDPV